MTNYLTPKQARKIWGDIIGAYIEDELSLCYPLSPGEEALRMIAGARTEYAVEDYRDGKWSIGTGWVSDRSPLDRDVEEARQDGFQSRVASRLVIDLPPEETE